VSRRAAAPRAGFAGPAGQLSCKPRGGGARGNARRFYSSLASFSGREAAEGEWKPTAWFMEAEDAEKLLETCKQDVADTREVYAYGTRFRRLKRRAKRSGSIMKWAIPGGAFATVEAVWRGLETNPPDQTWMSDPPDLRAPARWIADAVAK